MRPTTPTTLSLAATLTALALSACPTPPDGWGGKPSYPCEQGERRDCTCQTWQQGFITCGPDGEWSECNCAQWPFDPWGQDVWDAGFTPPPNSYFAVLIEDDPGYLCSTNLGSHGADIDAVQLIDGFGGAHVAWMEFVTGDIGSAWQCELPKNYTDPSQAAGAADASLDAGYVSLGGGWLVGEFQAAVRLVEDFLLVVYEVDQSLAPQANGEAYNVYAATDMMCIGPNQGCTIFIGSGVGQAVFDLWGTGI